MENLQRVRRIQPFCRPLFDLSLLGSLFARGEALDEPDERGASQEAAGAGVGDFTLVTKRTKKLQTLIDRAYKCDPRVNAWKREQERLREEKEVTVFSSFDL